MEKLWLGIITGLMVLVTSSVVFANQTYFYTYNDSNVIYQAAQNEETLENSSDTMVEYTGDVMINVTDNNDTKAWHHTDTEPIYKER